MCISLVCIALLYYNARCKKHKKVDFYFYKSGTEENNSA